ncbi:MAG: hypothetical protein IPJ64_14035 [Saprospiraceae bacterium]|nr:hypothetical protein [Saprospiraceae bacterium]
MATLHWVPFIKVNSNPLMLINLVPRAIYPVQQDILAPSFHICPGNDHHDHFIRSIVYSDLDDFSAGGSAPDGIHGVHLQTYRMADRRISFSTTQAQRWSSDR